jgi:hypothetical protein
MPECLHMSSTQCNHQHCPHTFPIYVLHMLQASVHRTDVNVFKITINLKPPCLGQQLKFKPQHH